MENKLLIEKDIKDSIETKKKVLEDKALLSVIEKIAEECVNALKNGKKVFFCGNGGSAADAQHLAAELSGKFYFDRDPLPSEALHANSSFLTAVANDYSYDEVYSRMIRGNGKKGDVLIGISTSGNSKNVIKAIEAANNMGIVTAGFTGQGGGKMKGICKYLIVIPSADTPRVQESHILAGHIICEIIEKEIFVK